MISQPPLLRLNAICGGWWRVWLWAPERKPKTMTLKQKYPNPAPQNPKPRPQDFKPFSLKHHRVSGPGPDAGCVQHAAVAPGGSACCCRLRICIYGFSVLGACLQELSWVRNMCPALNSKNPELEAPNLKSYSNHTNTQAH